MFRFCSRMFTPANDNQHPRARLIPLIGIVGAGGKVRLDRVVRLLPGRLFPNDPREA